MVGLNEIRERVAAAAGRSGRDEAEITLVAVSTTATADGVRAAIAAGHRDFGENRADRLEQMAAAFPEAHWHMIGRLQTNKVKRVGRVAALLHSVDRLRLAEAWARDGAGRAPVLIQVNVSGEAAKAGVAPEEAEQLTEQALELGLDVQGLMTIAPLSPRAEDSRPHYRRLAELRDRLAGEFPSVTALSMGMTNDFEVAVEEGATVLRVGRAIFGPSEESRG